MQLLNSHQIKINPSTTLRVQISDENVTEQKTGFKKNFTNNNTRRMIEHNINLIQNKLYCFELQLVLGVKRERKSVIYE